MKSIGISGISVHDHDAAALAAATLPRAEREARLGEIATSTPGLELLYLATCNRVEVVYRVSRASETSAPLAALGERLWQALGAGAATESSALRHWAGDLAVEHLFRVAAGLDSAALGEREIQGQVREALAAARRAGTCGPAMARLIEEALRAARLVHLRTQLGAGRLSLAEIACEHLLDRIRRTPAPPPAVALVGVSSMTRRAAVILAREGVPFVVVNRTPERALALVAEIGAGATQSLDEFRQRPPRVEAILTATAAPGPVLDRAALERLAAHTASQEAPLVVDLAVPPDVDPEAAQAAQVPRIGIDEIAGAAIGQRQGRESESIAAAEVVAEALDDLKRRLAERALAPVFTRIHRRYRETALEGIERLLARHGLELAGAARDDLERWAETLARRFAHLPTLGLRGIAGSHGLPAVKSFLAACDGSSFAELCDELEELEDLERLAPPRTRGEERR
jgi:glutamyl-tRNA reductase